MSQGNGDLSSSLRDVVTATAIIDLPSKLKRYNKNKRILQVQYNPSVYDFKFYVCVYN